MWCPCIAGICILNPNGKNDANIQRQLKREFACGGMPANGFVSSHHPMDRQSSLGFTIVHPWFLLVHEPIHSFNVPAQLRWPSPFSSRPMATTACPALQNQLFFIQTEPYNLEVPLAQDMEMEEEAEEDAGAGAAPSDDGSDESCGPTWTTEQTSCSVQPATTELNMPCRFSAAHQ